MKTIEKPSFPKLYAMVLVLMTVLSLLGAQYYLVREKNKRNNEDRRYFDDKITDLSVVLDELAINPYENYDMRCLEARWIMAQLCIGDSHAYAEIYLKDKKLFDSYDALPCVFGLDRSAEGSWFPYNYYLADVSYLEPIREYVEAGNFYDIETIYINKETHLFVPGWVRILTSPYTLEAEQIARINCKPEDMQGYTISFSQFSFIWLSEQIFDEKDENMNKVYYASLNPETGIYEINTESYPYEGLDETEWSIRYTDYHERSVSELFPIMRWKATGIALLIGLVASIVIALIIYFRKKAVYSVFEYRKKTTEAMAHDLKTPLATISAYAESLEEGLLKEEPDSSEDPENGNKNAEYAKKIRENVNEMNDMVEGILQFSKSEGGGGKILSKETDISELVNKCVDKYRDLFTQKEITVSLSGDTSSRKTDPKIFSQAIENLLSNCARYADEKSEVKVVLSEKTITISNRYSGEIKNLSELKKPFVKGESSRSNKGSGLGLSIADNDLQLLGYKLDLTFENSLFSAIIALG